MLLLLFDANWQPSLTLYPRLADPDLSNPTRNRWERPLDTIRSFEAAIEGDYARRSMHRAGKFFPHMILMTIELICLSVDTDPSANFSRRNSYYKGALVPCSLSIRPGV